jgi:hypothetical protein
MIDKSIFNRLLVIVRESLMHKSHYYITLSSRHSDSERKEFCEIIENNFISLKKFKGCHYLVDGKSFARDINNN